MQLFPVFGHAIHARTRIALAVALSLGVCANSAFAEEAEAIHPPGLPAGIDWTFNFDATFGAFGFANSLYTDPKPDQPSGNLSGNWLEGSVKPALSGVYKLPSGQEIYGKLSAVGERTYSGSPTLVGGDAASFDAEDMYIGWRSGNSMLGTENALELTGGRTQYKIGHGMLVWDGGAEGGSRGGYWTNARKAWKLAGIGRLRAGGSTFEAFYLEKDELPESDNNNQLAGINYEYAIGEDTTLGATYFEWNADSNGAPLRDGMNVYDLRAFTAPFASLKGLSFEFEYAKEDNGSELDAYAWNASIGYQFGSGWQPKLTYRYAFFEGDDPTTTTSESFDGLSTGFYDWGTWWQGEIAGEYFLANSNLISHQVRLHMKPNEAVGTGFIFYDFKLDQPSSLAAGVTSDDAAFELDWYADWAINKHFVMSFVAAYADPGKAIQQATGRTKDLYYGMVYASYSF